MKKQLDRFILTFFSNHLEIKHCFLGSDDDYNSQSIKQWKSAHIEFLQVTPTEFSRTYFYSVAISDLANVNVDEIESNLYNADIQSDCIEILEDFFGAIQWHLSNNPIYSTQMSYNILPFEDDTVDRTVGAIATFEIQMLKNFNVCAIPMKPGEN